MRWCLAVAVSLACAAPAEATAPKLSLPAKTLKVGEGQTLTVKLKLSRKATRPAAVRLTATTATAGPADFTRSSIDVLFLRRQQTKTIKIKVQQDALDEPDETFTLKLSRPKGLKLGRTKATVKISDDDLPVPVPQPQPVGPGVIEPNVVIGFDPLTVTEPAANGATAPHALPIRLTRASSAPVTVDYVINAIDDTSTTDIDLPSGTLTFAPGETVKVIPGDVKGDDLDENDEKARVTLSHAVGADLPDSMELITIVDNADDLPPAIVATKDMVTEGDKAGISLSLDAPSGRTVFVDVDTEDNTALAAQDFTAITDGLITFHPGETVKAFEIPTTENALFEPTESFLVHFSSPVTTPTAITTGITILDDD